MRSTRVGFVTFGLMLLTTLPLCAGEPLPPPWKHQDIGKAQTPGSAECAAEVFVVQGTMDIWGPADGCHIVWQPVHGDAELVARVASMENPGGVAHAKASLSVRESLDAAARQVTVCVTHTDGTQFLCRETANGKTTRVLPGAAAHAGAVPKGRFPCWLRLVRHGDEFSGYESADGEKWTLTGQIKLSLLADVVIGLAASSHKPDVVAKVRFDHVKLSAQPASSKDTAR